MGKKREAVNTLVAKFEEGREPVAVRAVIIRSLGNLRDRRARGVVLKAINDTENAVIRVEACRALGKVGLPEDATTLARVMAIDKLEDCRIAAIEGIGMLKSVDPRIYRSCSTAWTTPTPRSGTNASSRSDHSPARTRASIRPPGGATRTVAQGELSGDRHRGRRGPSTALTRRRPR